MSDLIEYFKRYIPISKEIEERINKITSEKELSKGEIILMDNSNKKEHIFVKEGCLRSYFKSEDGKEHTIQFAVKDWWIGDYTTLFSDEKSILRIESLMKSSVVVLNKNKLKDITDDYEVFRTFNSEKLTNRISSLEKRILSLLTLTATERYTLFVKKYAIFERIIPNYQIASYLGITPQSLSRIRKSISKKN